jgi:hypothetical protein
MGEASIDRAFVDAMPPWARLIMTAVFQMIEIPVFSKEYR